DEQVFDRRRFAACRVGRHDAACEYESGYLANHFRSILHVHGSPQWVELSFSQPTRTLAHARGAVLTQVGVSGRPIGRFSSTCASRLFREAQDSRTTSAARTLHVRRSPRSKALTLASVVSATLASDSLVRNAWCEVTMTLGNVSRRANTSSCKIWSERFLK